MYTTVGLVLFLLSATHPAAAAGDDLRVVAVHTASAPHVSVVVEPPAGLPEDESATETCSVTIDGESVETTVTPIASRSLSVALVIDTAGDLTPQELAAMQSGATEFLFGLPVDARTTVVAAGGEPEVVAPLSAQPAEALSAVTTLRPGGARAITAGTMLAAESLESAPRGPRAIVVYAHGDGEQGVSVEQLSQAVQDAEATLNVIRIGADPFWPSVVDRTGGVILPADAENMVQTSGRLVETLGDRYFVTFEVADDLPAVAQLVFRSGDQEHGAVVDLADAGTPHAASTEPAGQSGAGAILGVVAVAVVGVGLAALLVFAYVRRARRLPSAPGGEAAAETAMSAARVSPSGEPAESGPLPDQPVPSAPLPPVDASPVRSRPARGALSAAVQGRRLAQLRLEPLEEPAEGQQAGTDQAADPLAELMTRYVAEGRSKGFGMQDAGDTENDRAEQPPEPD